MPILEDIAFARTLYWKQLREVLFFGAEEDGQS